MRCGAAVLRAHAHILVRTECVGPSFLSAFDVNYQCLVRSFQRLPKAPAACT